MRANAEDRPLQDLLAMLRAGVGHDFTHYKRGTLVRRIARRVAAHRLRDMAAYASFVREHPRELEILFDELLIGVTSFFRKPGAWEALARAVTERLGADPGSGEVRAWVVGCSTGEEAYSLAIVLRECLDALGRARRVQVFATDVDRQAIAIARRGAYPLTIAGDVSPDRLRRFFWQQGDAYRVSREIRNTVVFACHDVITAPPFTQLDVLSCRNLLIYLDSELQSRLVPMFHRCLKPDGILFLGTSETVASAPGLFRPADGKWRLYRRVESSTPPGTRTLRSGRDDQVPRDPIDDLYTTNAELSSDNARLLSTNADLRRSNANLTASVEDLQSANEELQSIVADLRARKTRAPAASANRRRR
jgi:two-component system CheB/CheR fusion protein